MRHNAGRLKAIIAYELRKVNQALSVNENEIRRLRAENKEAYAQKTRLEAELDSIRNL